MDSFDEANIKRVKVGGMPKTNKAIPCTVALYGKDGIIGKQVLDFYGFP